MDLRTEQFVLAVNAALDEADAEGCNDGRGTAAAREILFDFIDWAQKDAPSWREVYASIPRIDDTSMREVLGGETLTSLAQAVCQIYICNAFSLQMVPAELLAYVRMQSIGDQKYVPIKTARSVVGHADTARLLGVPLNRETITLELGDVLYVAQLMGGRLPEGATTLPKGARFEWVQLDFATQEWWWH